MKKISFSLLLLCGAVLIAGFFLRADFVEYTSRGVSLENAPSSLDLSSRGLSSVPADVFEMTSLKSLDVSNNLLSGALPGEIRFLKNLQTLDASENAMTGVPAEIGQLSQLQYLDLSNNALTGLPNELGKLTSLIQLDLRGNAISPQDLDGIRAMLSKTEILVD